MNCQKGQIKRNGYTTSKGKKVKSSCIISQSNSGTKTASKIKQLIKSRSKNSKTRTRISKGLPTIIILGKNELGQFGYVNIKDLSIKERHIALKKAIKHLKPLSVFRKVVAIATLHKKTDKKLHDLLMDDSHWIKEQTEYKKDRKTSSRKSKILKKTKTRSKK